jgi:hypothetical protein
MDRDESAQLALAIQRSVEMRQALHQKLSGGEPVDLLKEWQDIERLDHEIVRKIRKRPPE